MDDLPTVPLASRESRPCVRAVLITVVVALAVLGAGLLVSGAARILNAPALGENVLPAMAAGEWNPVSASATQTDTLVLAPGGLVLYGDRITDDTWWFLHNPKIRVVERRIDGDLSSVQEFSGSLEIYDHDAFHEVATVPVVIESWWTQQGTSTRRMRLDLSHLGSGTRLGPHFPDAWTVSK